MAGTVIPIISKREYDFSNGTATVVALKAANVVAYKEGALLVRVHSLDFGAGSSIAVKLFTTAPSSEEPAVDFVGSTALATATVDSGNAVGDLEKATISDDFGGFLEVQVVGTLSTANCKATISADIVMKD